MDVGLTTEQELLGKTTAQFVQAACPLTRIREVAEAGTGVDADYLRQGADLGWFSLLVPEDHGGGSVSGEGVIDAAVLAMVRGRFLQPGPFVPTNVVAATLAAVGSTSHQSEVLPALMAGEATATWAGADAGGSWDAGAGVAATATDAGWVLTGRKGLVQDAGPADWLLVTADLDGTAVQFLVPAGAGGVTVEPFTSFDLSRRFTEVAFDGVQVTRDDLVGSADGDAGTLERQLQLAMVLTVAESVGAMDELFGVCLEYAKVRTAFGRPIGSFQAIKHLLADTSLLLEQSKAIALAAARAVQEQRDDAGEVASMAKSFVGEAGIQLAQSCWQVFGGIGYTWEHDLHLYLRRLTTDAALYGQPAWHRERICAIHGL